MKGTNGVVQFYKAIYPADYSDLSMYTQDELKKMATFFVKQDDDTNFGRLKECRESKLSDHDLARRCARADIHLLGLKLATIYTIWNMCVYFREHQNGLEIHVHIPDDVDGSEFESQKVYIRPCTPSC